MERKFVLTDEGIFDILGIEEENRKGKRERTYLKQFRKLASKYNPDSIWLRDDYGIYAKGYVADQTEDLIVVDSWHSDYNL